MHLFNGHQSVRQCRIYSELTLIQNYALLNAEYCLTLVVFKTNYSTLTFRKTRSRQNPTSLDICVSAISYKTSFGYRQKHNINSQLVWWFSKRHFNLVQVCDWLFWSYCHYICRSQKHAHNCYYLTLWGWRLLLVIWTGEISGVGLQ